MLGKFSCTCWPLEKWSALEKCLLISSAPFSVRFFFFFWNNMSSLHFGDISPLSDIWFANILFSMLIFFHFWFCCWFPLLYWSFLVSGSFTCLFLFVLPLPKIWCQILRKKLLPKPMSRNLPLCFILGIYGSGLTFTSIKFEFIFLCGVR